MAGGRGILDASGKLLIRSDGTVDVCEDCCGPYRQLFKCDNSGSTLYVRSSDAGEGVGVIYSGIRYETGAETTLGGTLLDAGDITVQSAGDAYTATLTGVDASPCPVCTVTVDGSYAATQLTGCTYTFADSGPTYVSCVSGYTSGITVRVLIYPSDNSIQQVIASENPTTSGLRYFNTGTLAQGTYFVGDSIPTAIASCSAALSTGGTAVVQFT